MSPIIEKYVTKRVAESKRKTNIKAIKSVMQKMHLSATEAMEALSIDETERSQYLTLL